MCAAGAGPGGRRSQAELGVCAQLITAMHCTAHVPRAYCFSGHFSLSSQSLTPTRLGKSLPRKSQEDRDQRGRGPHLQGPPPILSPALQGLEEAPCRVWLSFPPSPSWPLSCLPPAEAAAQNELRVGPAHPSRQPLAPAASGMLQPPSFSSSGPGSRLPQPAMGPHQPGPTPMENPKSYCI